MRCPICQSTILYAWRAYHVLVHVTAIDQRGRPTETDHSEIDRVPGEFSRPDGHLLYRCDRGHEFERAVRGPVPDLNSSVSVVEVLNALAETHQYSEPCPDPDACNVGCTYCLAETFVRFYRRRLDTAERSTVRKEAA